MSDHDLQHEQPSPAPRSAASYAATRDWPGYFSHVAGKPPRDTLLQALERFDSEGTLDASTPPLALDLGAGEGRDTAELLRRGWRVIAYEPHADGMRRLSEREDLVHTERLETCLVGFEDMTLPSASLINASFSLPFCPPDHFQSAWDKILAAIEPGGRFTGQLFGDRDTWAALPDRSHQTHEHVQELLAGMKLERFDEEEREGGDCTGAAKHWHVFHIIAQRPST